MKRPALALLLLALLVLAPGAAQAKRAAKATITGTFATGGRTMTGWRVLGLASSGRVVSAPVTGLRFTLKVRKADVKGLSLQLVDADSGYAGPIVLRRVKRIGATRLSASAKLALGRIDLKQGYASLHRSLGAKSVLSTGSAKVRLTAAGAPVGAGRLGLIRKSNRRSDRADGGGALGGACTAGAAESQAGGDCDADGVPNFADVDDNGNLTLDSVDTATADTSARVNITFGTLVGFSQQLNAYAAETTVDDINAWLGAGGPGSGMSMGFYLSERFIDPASTSFPFRDVWLTCTEDQPWCAPGAAGATATVGGMSPNPAILPTYDGHPMAKWDTMPWQDYTGSTCPEDTTGSAPACEPIAGGHPNSLIGMDRLYGGGKPDRVWIASVTPNSTDTLGAVRPKDVLTLYAEESDGTVYAQPATITPYFVTSPALQGYIVDGTPTTVAYPLADGEPGGSWGRSLELGADGRLTLRIWRPQRLQLPGETAEFYDVAGLRWGVMIDSYYDSSGNYQNLHTLGDPCMPTSLGGVDLLPHPDVKAQMVDATTADFATVPANRNDPSAYIEFTIDADQCMADAGVPNDAQGTRIQIRAQGAEFSGGQTNMSGVSVEVRRHGVTPGAG